MCAWSWMKCCVSTDVGTWTNWLTFEPDPGRSPDAGTWLLSPISYRLRDFTALPRLPASCAATRNFTSGKIPHIRAVVLKWFYSLSRRKTCVRGKCALLSALLVVFLITTELLWVNISEWRLSGNSVCQKLLMLDQICWSYDTILLMMMMMMMMMIRDVKKHVFFALCFCCCFKTFFCVFCVFFCFFCGHYCRHSTCVLTV